MLGKLVDELYEVRQGRYDLQKAVEKAKQKEVELSLRIQNELNTMGIEGAQGTKARVALKVEQKVVVEDWPSFYDFIKSRDAFYLLTKHTNEAALKELMEVEGSKVSEFLKCELFSKLRVLTAEKTKVEELI